MKILIAVIGIALITFSPLQAQSWGQRNTTAQTIASANGTQTTQTDNKAILFVASGATTATIAGVSITMIAGEVLPIRAEGGDTLRAITYSVASGALIVIETK